MSTKSYTECPKCGARGGCEKHGITRSGIDMRSRVEPTPILPFERYRGWDRIHDDNKAEGRPVGGQWSDHSVHYVNGVKTC